MKQFVKHFQLQVRCSKNWNPFGRTIGTVSPHGKRSTLIDMQCPLKIRSSVWLLMTTLWPKNWELRLLLKDFRPPNYICVFRDSAERREEFHICNSINTNVIRQNWGYELCLKRSGITGAGQGVFVQSGSISKGQIVALYSGTIYLPSQPIL